MVGRTISNTESRSARTHARREAEGVVKREMGRGDLERQNLRLDLIACTSAFKWVINYT